MSVVEMPLVVSAARLHRSLRRLSAMADMAPQDAFDAATEQWFADLRAHLDQLARANGLTPIEMLEALAP